MTALPTSRARASARARTRPKLNQIAVFVEVANAGSFAAAARSVRRTQPAVSQSIARLEDIYGGDLFERRPGASLRLTPLGRALLPSAELLLNTVDHHMIEAARQAQGQTGILRVGVNRVFGSRRLHSTIAAFGRERPDVNRHFVEWSEAELLSSMSRRAVDLAIMPHHPGPIENRFAHQILWAERIVLAMRDDHALAALPTIPTSALEDLQVHRLEDCRLLSNPFGSIISEHHVSPATLIQLVALGLGVAVLLESEQTQREGVVFRPLLNAPSVELVAIWMAGDRNPLRHRFLTLLKAASGEQCTPP